uniref:C2H2-type domain-containing protein n=1 Tax=Cyprinus carpio TaxID=7962 RepID=A0A8C2FB20_CYPCA
SKGSERIYKERRKFQCEHCGMCFSTMMRLRLHACEQNVEKPFRCPLCRKEFQYRVSINAHIAHLCKICGKNFKYSSLLQQHQYLHTGQKPYHCSYCGKMFAFAQNMRAHYRQHKMISARSEAPITNHNVSLVRQGGKENVTVEQ